MNVMKDSQPSTLHTGKGPQMSVWMISKIPALRLAPFLICFTNFPLILCIAQDQRTLMEEEFHS